MLPERRERMKHTMKLITEPKKPHLGNGSFMKFESSSMPITKPNRRLSFDTVLKELQKSHFGVLSTVTKDGRSHSAGVFYSLSPSARPLEIYVMTRTKLKKARNIMNNSNVSFVVPLRRRFLTFVSSPCIEFQGHAEIIDWKDEIGVAAFKTSFMGRTIVNAYDDMYRQGDTTICFLRITPDPTIFTYGVGVSVWEMRRHMETGSAKVEIPLEYQNLTKVVSEQSKVAS